MASSWFATVFRSTKGTKQQMYGPVSEYRDDSSIDGEKGELLSDNRLSFSVPSDDGRPPIRTSSSKTFYRLSIAFNIVLVGILTALITSTWHDLVLKWDKFDNGFLKRTSRPCMFLIFLFQNYLFQF
jgi:hypothetical protein